MIVLVCRDSAGLHLIGQYADLDSASEGLRIGPWEPYGIKAAGDGRPRYWRANGPGARIEYCAFRVDEASQHLLDSYHAWVYDALVGEYRARQTWHDEAVTAMAQALATWLPRGATVLDVGPGTGQLMAAFAREGLAPCGIDISGGMASAAAANCPAAPVFRGSFLDNPVSRAAAVSAVAVVHLFPSRQEQQVIGRLIQLTEPRGVLLISTTVAQQDSEGWQPKSDYELAMPRYRRGITREGLNRMCEVHGLDVLQRIERKSHGKRWQCVIARNPVAR